MVRKPSQRAGSGRDALLEGRVALPEGREWSGDLPKELGVIGNGWEAFLEDREWSGDLPKELGVIRNGWEAFPEDQEWS